MYRRPIVWRFLNVSVHQQCGETVVSVEHKGLILRRNEKHTFVMPFESPLDSQKRQTHPLPRVKRHRSPLTLEKALVYLLW